MKGCKIIQNILLVLVLAFCFVSVGNAQLPPPFDRPQSMFEIFLRNLSGEREEAEENQNLYDGIRFARRQQCLENNDVKDITDRKARIDQCDGIRISGGGSLADCDRRQYQDNVSFGTIGKLQYGNIDAGNKCTSPGVNVAWQNDRKSLYGFYKRFREVKDNETNFKEKTRDFAIPNNNGGINFIEINSDGSFGSNYSQYSQTIYSSSYDNEYKKCNVGNLGHATHSNDARTEDYSADGGGFFIPMLQSEDFFDDLSNETCANFFIPHMGVFIGSMIAGEVASAAGSASCSALATMTANAKAIMDGTAKLKKVADIKKTIGYMQKAKNAGKAVAKTTAKMGVNAFLNGAFYCYDGISNGMTVASSAPVCNTLYPPTIPPNPPNVQCNTLATTCGASAVASLAACGTSIASLIAYYTELAVKFSKANQTFQTNQMCGSEWLTWEFNKKTQQWQPDTEKSYSGCLKNLFIDIAKFDDNEYKNECKKYGKFTNGKLIGEEGESKFDFSNLAAKQKASIANITNQYYREFWFRGIEYEDRGGCKNPAWDDSRKIRYLGYKTEHQRYYARGPVSEAGDNKVSIDYACHRFLRNVPGKEAEENTAYQCCKRKAQTSICIEEKLVYGGGSTSVVEDLTKVSIDRENDRKNLLEHNRQNNYTEHKYKFCSLGDNSCQLDDLNDTRYAIFSSKKTPEYICAKTRNHCPYDHYLAGGTEKKFESFLAVKEGENPTTIVTANFCQHLAHCAKTENSITRIPLPSNSYLSLACRNFVGDSLFISSINSLSGGKNETDLSKSDIIVQKKSRNLTAPMVQCLKETLENYLLRTKAVICLDEKDYQTEEYKKYKICKSNPVVAISPGQSANASVFVELRNKFQTAIKMALTLSVAIFGLLMLFAGNKVNEMLSKKVLTVFVFKIAIVSYFALGNAWESFFMKIVFEAPLQFAELAFQPNVRKSENNVYQVKTIASPSLSKSSDGCIFPPVDKNGNPIIKVNSDTKKITQIVSSGIFHIDGSTDYFKIENGVLKKSSTQGGPYIYTEGYEVLSYPANKEYLRIFDTFDCKIAHLLGYSADANVPNFFKMIFIGFFSGGLGFAFMIASVLFAFFMILIALRVVHLMIVTIIVLSILVYISPLAFCCLMFNKTKKIFENWLKQVMGYIVQPVIIFAYLGLFLTVLDNSMIGTAKFADFNNTYDGNFKNLDCIDDPNGKDIFDRPIKQKSALCDMAKFGLIENKVENTQQKSIQPFNLIATSFKYNPTNPGEGRERLKTMFKLALITFIFYKIFEYITTLSALLTGAEDSTGMLNALKQNIEGIGKKASSIVAGAEKIGRDMAIGGTKDRLKNLLSRGFQKGKEAFSNYKQKNTENPKNDSKGDSTGAG